MSKDYNAFLFVWNSEYWPFAKIEPQINDVKNTGKAEDIWGIASYKKVRVGDRIFITRVNAKVRGIFASGTVISKPEEFINYKGRNKLGVWIEFDTFLNPDAGQILDIEFIKANTSTFQQWSPQSSGILINKKVATELEILWADYLDARDFLLNVIIPEPEIIEGTSYQLVQTIYERNRNARIRCLQHHGHSCTICGFNFEEKYGEIGKEFIHVHHLTQISNGPKETNPINDLIPVCPNCHAMLHKRNPPFTIDELKNRISGQL